MSPFVRSRPRAAGRWLLSALTVLTAVVSVGVDANASHLFNEDWPPHAVFHDVVLLGFLSALAIVGLWLLWRLSAEPNVSLAVAALIPALFWAMFFVAAFFPGSSPAAHVDEPPPVPIGTLGYPNMLIAMVVVPLSGLGYLLGRERTADVTQ